MKIKGLKCKVFPIETPEYPTKAKRPHFSVLNKKKIKDDFNLEIPHWKESLVLMLS
jgi:dTDP-4-dehydrorhamnose reductase